MIIGNGDIASAIIDRDDLLFFASGVSNSREYRASEYRREEELLLKQPREAHVVYFSSLCVFYSETMYACHKKYMETIVKERFRVWTIMRLGNITWGDNPHTLINYLRIRRMMGEELDILDTYRYIVDKDEFQHWLGLIPTWSCEMNVPGRRMKVIDIVREFVDVAVDCHSLV